MGIAAPQTTDESYFGLLTTKGILKIYNYTIIESQATYNKYVRDNFGVRRFNESRTEEEIEQTPQGLKMAEEGFPLVFRKPL